MGTQAFPAFDESEHWRTCLHCSKNAPAAVYRQRSTVRSDVEERIAEERLDWTDKNFPADLRHQYFVKRWPITFCTVWDKNVIRTQPGDKHV